MNLDYYYLKVIEQKTDKLIQKITEDYGEEYNLTFQQIKDYIKTYNIQLNITKPKKQKTIKTKRDVKDIDRCQARTWGNGYMNIKHYRKYNDNCNKLDPTKFGSQCRHKKIKNNIYCSRHLNELTHGNYYLIPSEKIMGYYLMKNRHKFL